MSTSVSTYSPTLPARVVTVRPIERAKIRRVIISPSSAPPSQRLVSLDALRGFTMFWIMGGREVALALVAVLFPALSDTVETQLTHPRWEGFVAWDLIMPLFLFLVGTSMPFALGKRIEQHQTRQRVCGRIARRVGLLWLLGMIAQGSLLQYDFDQLELYSNALQAIAVGYLVTSVALLYLPTWGQIALCAGLTLLYGALLMWVPFPGHAAGTLEQYANLARYVDVTVLGHFKRDHSFTWILTSIAFPATVLLGAMAGHLVRARLPVPRKLVALVGIGVALLAGGWVWSYWLPLNRHLWTSSMILWAGGWSFLLVALFYAVIDVAGVKGWSFPFVVIGANALMAYVFDHVFDRSLSSTLFQNLADRLPCAWGELVIVSGEVAIVWLILWFLYRHRTFLRA